MGVSIQVPGFGKGNGGSLDVLCMPSPPKSFSILLILGTVNALHTLNLVLVIALVMFVFVALNCMFMSCPGLSSSFSRAFSWVQH